MGETLECQMSGAVVEERYHPLNQVQAHVLAAEEGEKGSGLYMVEATLHMKEKGGDLEAEQV